MDRIKAQVLRVIQIFPACAQRKDALAQPRGRIVSGLARLASVAEHRGCPLGQPRLAIHLAQVQQPAIAADFAALEVRGHPPSF